MQVESPMNIRSQKLSKHYFHLNDQLKSRVTARYNNTS